MIAVITFCYPSKEFQGISNPPVWVLDRQEHHLAATRPYEAGAALLARVRWRRSAMRDAMQLSKPNIQVDGGSIAAPALAKQMVEGLPMVGKANMRIHLDATRATVNGAWVISWPVLLRRESRRQSRRIHPSCPCWPVSASVKCAGDTSNIPATVL